MFRGRDAARLAATCVAALCCTAMWAGGADASTFHPGSLVLSAARADQLCGGSPGDLYQPAGEGSTLLPDGRIALECADGELVAYDLAGGYVAWSIDTKPYVEYTVGADHVLLVSRTTTPPTGLQGSTTTYTLTAKSTSNGKTVWTVPFTDQGDVSSDDDFTVAYEGPSGNPAHPDETVLQYSTSMTSFDSNTGATIWHEAAGGYITSQAYYEDVGPYLGYGVNLAVHATSPDQSSFVEEATSPASGASVWQEPVPAAAGAIDDPTPEAIMPDGQGNAWLFWDTGYDARNIATGAEIAAGAYPAGWNVDTGFLSDDNVYFEPPYALYTDGSHLELYNLQHVSAPVWSVPADDVSVDAAGTKNALVSADAGDKIISLSDGSIVATPSEDANNQASGDSSGWGTAVDGYLPFVGSAGVSVLELETPSVTVPRPSVAAGRRSPGLTWLHAVRHGRKTFVVTARLTSGATGRVTLHAKRVRRSITRACKVSRTSVRCTVKLPIPGAWSVRLAYVTHTSKFRSAVTRTHVLRAR